MASDIRHIMCTAPRSLKSLEVRSLLQLSVYGFAPNIRRIPPHSGWFNQHFLHMRTINTFIHFTTVLTKGSSPNKRAKKYCFSGSV
jgi:hypothetical protein